jgi:2-keto-4-pentenoate hydratase
MLWQIILLCTERGHVMTDPQHDAAARALRDAYSKGAIAPMRQWLDPVDIAGAYAVQAINTRFWVDQGRRIVGRKAGLTAKAVQTQLGVDQPDFGVLFDDMMIPDGGTLDPARCLQPKAEAEIAFVLGADLPTRTRRLRWRVQRLQQFMPPSKSSTAALPTGRSPLPIRWQTMAPRPFYVLSEVGKPLAGLDIYSAGMVMEMNGQIVSLGAGAAALGHPLNAAAWLASTLAQRVESRLTQGRCAAGGCAWPDGDDDARRSCPRRRRRHRRSSIQLWKGLNRHGEKPKWPSSARAISAPI